MAYTRFSKEAPRIRGVLFDMDGLVLDTEILYSRFWMAACHFYGHPMTKEQSLQMRSLGEADSAANLRRWFGPGVDYHRIRNKRVELMDAFIAKEGVIPKPGIWELLDYLDQAGISSAIATSSPPERAKAHLGSVGLDVRFDRICSGHQVAHPKPAPDIYLHAAAALGLDPGECLALEDSPAGIRSARAAGCHAVMIPDLDQPDVETLGLLFAKADSLADVAQLLKELK